MTYYTYVESPIGTLLLVSDGKALTGLHMHHHEAVLAHMSEAEANADAAPLPKVRDQLNLYFEGRLTTFEVPLAPHGSEFQKQVWKQLCRIPYAETTSYGEISRRLGEGTQASRAVGLANGQNPIAVIIPCHRVIGANGKLVGYGGGFPRKKALLSFEANVRDFGPQVFPPLAPELLV